MNRYMKEKQSKVLAKKKIYEEKTIKGLVLTSNLMEVNFFMCMFFLFYLCCWVDFVSKHTLCCNVSFYRCQVDFAIALCYCRAVLLTTHVEFSN